MGNTKKSYRRKWFRIVRINIRFLAEHWARWCLRSSSRKMRDLIPPVIGLHQITWIHMIRSQTWTLRLIGFILRLIAMGPKSISKIGDKLLNRSSHSQFWKEQQVQCCLQSFHPIIRQPNKTLATIKSQTTPPPILRNHNYKILLANG